MSVTRIPATTTAATDLPNVAVGSVDITTAVANTPVSATITGFNLAGGSGYYGLATAETTTPHLVIASVMPYISKSFDGIIIYLNRSTIGTSTVNYIVWQRYV